MSSSVDQLSVPSSSRLYVEMPQAVLRARAKHYEQSSKPKDSFRLLILLLLFLLFIFK